MATVWSFFRRPRLGGRKPEMLVSARPNINKLLQLPISLGNEPSRFLLPPALITSRYFNLPTVLGMEPLS